MANSLTRRSFVKWSALAAGGASLAGFTGCVSSENDAQSADEAAERGEWKTGACMNNCSNGSARCLLKVYVEDGVPLLIKTDEDTDSIEYLQRRACPRGRAQISSMLSPARVKYPMKRKTWSPDKPNKELRGKDEWERISWEEALDYVANEIQKVLDTFGNRAILSTAFPDIEDTYFDPMVCLFNRLGGAMLHFLATESHGSWPAVEYYMTGTRFESPDYLSMMESDLQFHFGNNWMANKGGNTAYQLGYAQEQGSKVIIVDPWLNQTAQALADEWIPIRPGTDTAFVLGMAYHQISNDLYDHAYLDKYCIGFDADHMPEGADPKDNFKDYVLGTYDGEPKTPEWAEKICGVTANDTRRLAEEIHAAKKVNFFGGMTVSKVQAGEMFPQVFYTLAFMHGGIGSPGNFASWVGLHEGLTSLPYAKSGDSSNGAERNPVNPLKPPIIIGGIVDFDQIEDPTSWDYLDAAECWQNVRDGAYGRDNWPGGRKPLDIHMIYSGGYRNSLNSLCNTNVGIEVYRSMDFVFGANPFFCPSVQYADIVFPIATWWEKGNVAWVGSYETVYWADRIMEPLFESKPETYLAEELSKRLGIDPTEVNTMTDAEREYYSLAGSIYLKDDKTQEYGKLLTITQEDIDELGLDFEPQEGKIPLDEFKSRGLYKTERKIGDNLGHIPWEAYYNDPEANPLETASGKFEIYCKGLADAINAMGYCTISPIGKWQANAEQGQGAQTEEYPLLLWTPHTLRRAHTVNDNVVSLREAFPQECFMNTVDAEARGVKSGDTVLMSSPHGKVLRPAKVLPTVIPGAVALQDGAWIEIDEETGIDLGGNPNMLQAPSSSGQGTIAWTGTIVQVEKYTGHLELVPDKNRPLVMPVGIEQGD